MTKQTKTHTPPSHRKLRGYAFDPSLSLGVETADINDLVYKVPWEDLRPGPIGEYVEVVDYDPTVGLQYDPVDLDHRYVLADDGVPPSESNPQFHQQMVYAVTMLTITNFEKALGRKILWSTRLLNRVQPTDPYEEYVPKLRIYPHALREANAYYSPMKKALLFGYFEADPAEGVEQMPGSLVFTCLSHDIIAHEVTHAILDGLHRNYNRPTNPDVLAFHEAFADIVALFQHFSFPEVLKHQIAKTRGDLERQSLLGELAQEFGTAVGHYGSLRSALGEKDEHGDWQPARPDPNEYRDTLAPHRRGSILVSAVFEAFLTIYKRRVADLLRIASGGTGVLSEGEIHPDLVNRLADEASKTASQVLTMCIRALDYCPPVDLTFGDFLRAVITADYDLCRNDTLRYRIAFIEAFRRRGIFPEDVRSLSEDSLRYPRIDLTTGDADSAHFILREFLQEYRKMLLFETSREVIYEKTREVIRGNNNHGMGLHQRLSFKGGKHSDFEKMMGLVFGYNCEALGVRSTKSERASFQILNLRAISRWGPEGHQAHQVIFGIVQRMGAIVRNGKYEGPYVPEVDDSPEPESDRVEVVGGATLIYDLEAESIYIVNKPLLDLSEERCVYKERIEKQAEFIQEFLPMSLSGLNAYFGDGRSVEPFAFLHHC